MPGRLPAPGGAGAGNGGAAAAGVAGIGFDLGAGGVAVRPRGIRAAAVPFGRPLVRWPRAGIATPAPPSGPGAGSGFAPVCRGRSVLADWPSHDDGPTGARLPLVWPGWAVGNCWLGCCAGRACGGWVRSGWLLDGWLSAGWLGSGWLSACWFNACWFNAACCAGCCDWAARREPLGIPLAWRGAATLGSAAGRCVGAADRAPPATGLGIRCE
jgi:hypothetical protein